MYSQNEYSEYHDSFLDGNEQIEKAIHECYESSSREAFLNVLETVHVRMCKDGHFIFPVDSCTDVDGKTRFEFKTIQLDDQRTAAVAFTSQEEFSKSPPSEALSGFIDSVFTMVRDNDCFAGVLLNPWGESFFLTRKVISAVLERDCTEPESCKPLRDPYLAELDAMTQPYVNAHINNISFPVNIEELELFVYKHGHYNVEDILNEPDTNWTVPRNAKIGDIVLFYHAKTAIARITALVTKVRELPDDTEHDKPLLLEWLEKARELYKRYGGKVFAVGRVTGSPEYLPTYGTETEYHWHGRVYADVGDIVVLDNPIDISEFNSFIKVSRQSAITPLPSREFNGLRNIILEKNSCLPKYFLKCEIGNFNLAHINSGNFIAATKEYRRRFLLEIDFRSYYVDYLLKGLAKRRFWQECICHTKGKPNYFVDNVFQYGNVFYLLEVKLNIQLEKDLRGQLKQYIHADYLYLDKEATMQLSNFERSFMYVIDTEALYRYDGASDTLTELVRLDEVTCVNDIAKYIGTENKSPRS